LVITNNPLLEVINSIVDCSHFNLLIYFIVPLVPIFIVATAILVIAIVVVIFITKYITISLDAILSSISVVINILLHLPLGMDHFLHASNKHHHVTAQIRFLDEYKTCKRNILQIYCK